MNNESNLSIQDPAEQAPSEDSTRRAQQAWRRLGQRIRSITPADLVRFLLTVGMLVVIGWLIWFTRVALIPFFVGGVIAYVVLPLVNRLDRFMPRILAVLLVLSLVLLVVGGFLVLLAPILVRQLYYVYLSLPGIEEMRGYLQQLNAYLATLPEPTQATIREMSTRATQNVRENLNVYLGGLVSLTVATLLGLVNTFGFVLGFLVMPTWLLTVLQDQRHARLALNRLLPGWLRGDFWAVVGIFDRAFGTFIRGQVLIGLVVGVLVYLGLELLVWLMGLQGNVRIVLLLAMFAGLTQLIPSIGPWLGAIPAIVVGFSVSWQLGLLVIGLYILIQWLVLNSVTSRIERSIIDVHPAILILIIVALSQFGFWWVLLAAPVTAVVRDLFRYTYGRLSDPPRPAGVLPGQPLPAQAEALTPDAQQSSSQIPLVYRRGRALRQVERQS